MKLVQLVDLAFCIYAAIVFLVFGVLSLAVSFLPTEWSLQALLAAQVSQRL